MKIFHLRYAPLFNSVAALLTILCLPHLAQAQLPATVGVHVSNADVNEDGIVDYIDVRKIDVFVEDELFDASLDVNSDGAVTVEDSRIVVGLIDPIVGDINLDGSVDGADFGMFLGNWGTNSTGWTNGDFDYSGTLDGADFSFFLGGYGVSGGNASRPVN